MSESTDNPTLDVEALTALEKAATPAPWEAQMVQPNMAGNHQWYLHPVPRRPAGVHATGRGEDIDLIVAMRNQLPALLAELAALQVQYAGVQMERDLAHEQLRGWRKRAAGSGETTDGEVAAL